MLLRGLLSFVVFGAVACSAPVPRARYVYRVARIRDAARSCDPSDGTVRAVVAPPYLAVRDDVVNYRVFACETLEGCALATDGAARDGGASWSVPVPSFVFTTISGTCDGTASTWRSGPVGGATLQLDELVRTLTAIPREASGVCAVDIAESRTASTPCDLARRFEGELVNGP